MISFLLQRYQKMHQATNRLWDSYAHRALGMLRMYLPLMLSLAALAGAAGAYLFLYRSPDHFPVGSVVTIAPGATAHSVARELYATRVIRSPLFLEMITRLSGKQTGIIAGDYFFSRPLSVREVVGKITKGDYGLVPIRITIPEGATSFEIAELCEKKFGRFDKKTFLELARDKEGYFFPDTYFFLPNVKAPEIAQTMQENFYKKIAGLYGAVSAFGKPLRDVVTMASLLEKEARGMETRQRVAGVLWNRLKINMPLQVDAVFLYINGKNTYELTRADLATTSPYNTYRHKGLPLGPIGNPGLGSLRAAITPIPSEYLFYLSDRYGNMYYARTFEEHKDNKSLYVY